MEVMPETAATRLHCVLARDVDIAVVYARGPSEWWQILKWNIAERCVEQGAWFHGHLYPLRGGVSPDGKYFAYYALKPACQRTEKWIGSTSYSAIAKIPWMTALAAWKECGTWEMSYDFERVAAGPMLPRGNRPQICADGEPKSYRGYRAKQLERVLDVERLRGWVENKDEETPEPHPLDAPWSTFQKTHEPSGHRLTFRFGEYVVKPSVVANRPKSHWFSSGNNRMIEHPNAAWMDFASTGDVLIATLDGTLQIGRIEQDSIDVIWSYELGPREPDPKPAPAWAQSW